MALDIIFALFILTVYALIIISADSTMIELVYERAIHKCIKLETEYFRFYWSCRRSIQRFNIMKGTSLSVVEYDLRITDSINRLRELKYNLR